MEELSTATAELWRTWVERGQQGSIEDERAPNVSAGRRPPTTRLFVSTDDKLGDELELYRGLERASVASPFERASPGSSQRR
jgi:hypothetical protein